MAKTEEITIERRRDDRRTGEDRRQNDIPVAEERRQAPRRKVQRRRQIDPTTCERDYSQDEIEFMQALDAYKRANGRMFPTCSEILEVVRDLGYVRLTPDELELVRSVEFVDETEADGETLETEDLDQEVE